ncbi:MAG: S8 family peptidase [Dehalococcoidia bacterium]|jgi:subtilisin family serine protease
MVVLGGAFFLAASIAGNAFCNSWPAHPVSALGAADATEAVPGQLLVKFHEPLTTASRAQIHHAAGSQELSRIDGLDVSVVAVEPGTPLEEAASRYRALPDVEYAEPNYILKADLVPNDPFYSIRQQWYYDLINASKAWDAETGDPKVIIAIVDTGVDVTHPDLQANIWTNPGEIAGNGVDDDNNGCVDDVHGCNFVDSSESPCHYSTKAPNNDVDDDEGHGTFAAGVAAAKGNNQIGVIGAAPGVTIMPVKALDCNGAGTTSSAAAGVLYAARAGAKVINMSFGGDDESATLRAALQQAHDVYGAVIVAAAGNSAKNLVAFPARYDKVIAVSASDHRKPDTKAIFSNWGPEVDVTAPGVDIASTVPLQFCGADWPCFGNQPYATASGTSFSTPLVSGAAALILSVHPDLTPDQVKEQLMSTAAPLPDGSYPNWAGAGRIQMDLALQKTTYRLGLAGVMSN